MDLQTELKRLERLNKYLELLQDCKRCHYGHYTTMQVAKKSHFGMCYENAEKMSKRYMKLYIWLENRYQLALNN